MIAYLKGTLIEMTLDNLLVDVQGVGYEVHCSSQTLSELESLVGKTIEVWIYTHLREEALLLFGFSTKVEKNLFMSLLKVNGIGPKMAITILSGASFDSLQTMIEAGDAKGLSKLPKVGKKTAEQMILTLKGKLVLVDSSKGLSKVLHQDVSSALLNLGFKASMVAEFIESLPPETPLQEGIKEGLKVLSGHSS